jgi:hypothetical protein
VAVDVASSRAQAPAAPGALARVAAIPGWVWLSGIVLASFAGRFLAAGSRPAPYYLPDEYIYPSIARSLAEHGRPLIRGAGAHFPALLEPLVTAPVWVFTNDPVTAFRLTQGVHAFFFSLAAIPAYLLCRRLGLSLWIAVAVAALTVAVPDGVYSSTMLAEPLAYPLVLAAVYAGVCMVADGTVGAQLGFALFSALAVAARIQYAIVPVAVLAAQVVADRARIHRSLRRTWLALVLIVGTPVALVAALGKDRVLGVYAHPSKAIDAAEILHWIGREGMLLTYAGGWAIIPGALAGLTLALFRSHRRAELAFAVTTVVLAGGLLLASAQVAQTDSQRFQERYLFALVPLLGVAFGLYVKRGLPWRVPVGLISAALLVLAARIPLSGFAAAHNKDDSPTLWAVIRLEGLVSVGNGALAVALIAAALSILAALLAFRKAPAALILLAAIVACCSLSAGASAFDSRTSQTLRGTLPTDLRWVDHSHLGAVDLLAPPGSRKEQSWQQLFWNTSLKRLLLLGSPPIDHFAAKHVQVGRDGTLLVDGRTLRRPLLVQTYASTVQLSGVRLVRRQPIFDLYRPTGIPRVRLIAAGRYADDWLAPRGVITVWTMTAGTLQLNLAQQPGTQLTPMRFRARGIERTVKLRPGQRMTLTFRVPAGGHWNLHFRTKKPGYLGDRAVSVIAKTVAFRPRRS